MQTQPKDGVDAGAVAYTTTAAAVADEETSRDGKPEADAPRGRSPRQPSWTYRPGPHSFFAPKSILSSNSTNPSLKSKAVSSNKSGKPTKSRDPKVAAGRPSNTLTDQGTSTAGNSSVGMSRAASVAHALRSRSRMANSSIRSQTRNFRDKIRRDFDSDAVFELMSKELVPPATKPKPKKAPLPAKVSLPCPGLTAAYNEQVGHYLNRTGSTGAGSSCWTLQFRVIQKGIHGSSEMEKQHVYRSAASAPISPRSKSLLQIRPIYVTFLIRIKTHNAGQIYARFQGLEALVSEDNNYSLKQRYVQHVLNGDFKNDTIFNGIIEAKILAKTREIKGLGMQNFKHSEDVDAVFGLFMQSAPALTGRLRNISHFGRTLIK
ncbi:hypothetical protein B0H10DRAFT_1973510 [Mycena sp. CBHHK59/15]|nr:hypothetical protein B0H10DRAFT_1973510 [Mycena sp. CBHHK59/15]